MTRTDMRERGWHRQMRWIGEIQCGLLVHLRMNAVAHTQYGLGARGIDWIRNKVGSDPETVVFPIYDGHGNMIYTLKRDGTDDYLLGNKRIYGAWGGLRHDSNPGDGPNTQYVGNLGHKKDNESGLTYMRARYYEPWTGRFISEDPARDGWNWFAYCSNEPIGRSDPTGLRSFLDNAFAVIGMILAIAALRVWLKDPLHRYYNGYDVASGHFFGLASTFFFALAAFTADETVNQQRLQLAAVFVLGYQLVVAGMTLGAKTASKSHAFAAAIAAYAYGLWLIGEIVSQDVRDMFE